MTVIEQIATLMLVAAVSFIGGGHVVTETRLEPANQKIKTLIEEKQTQIENFQKPEVVYDQLIRNVWSIGNKDTVHTEIFTERQINHWVPGKVVLDTIVRKFSIKIVIESQVRRTNIK